MELIEIDEVADLLKACRRIGEVIAAIGPCLDFIERRLAEIETQCNVWDWRIKNMGDDDDED